MTSPEFPPPVPFASLPYQQVDYQRMKDADHLRLLSIFHYVHGALVILGSSLALFYLVFGIVLIQNPGSFATTPATQSAASANANPPEFLGYVFVAIGAAVLLIGWTVGILTLVCGRCINQRRRYLFTLIMAGVSCLLGITGIVLGVFTFIVLLRPSVKAEYGQPGPLAG